jgi:hypothetical protein
MHFCPGATLHGTQDILRFLYALRRLLRRYPHACACVSLAPHLCTSLWAGSGWVQKVGWVTDATISMSGFGGAHTSKFRVSNCVMTAPQLIRRFQHFFLHTMVWCRFINCPHRIVSSPRATKTLPFGVYRRLQQQILAPEKIILHSGVCENGSSLRRCILIWREVSQSGVLRLRRL